MNFKDEAQKILTAEEAKAKGWFSTHKALWITAIASAVVGFIVGRLV